MTQEEKSILLKDLCARLSYGVCVKYNSPEFIDVVLNLKGIESELCTIGGEYTTCRHYPIFKDNTQLLFPYLRSMTSMTEEEHEFYDSMFIEIEGDYLAMFPTEVIDYFNAHHFDYHNLIGRGLAIEVTEENNPYEEFNS